MEFDPLMYIRTRTQGQRPVREVPYLERFFANSLVNPSLFPESLAVWNSDSGQFLGEAPRDVQLEGCSQDYVFEREFIAALFVYYVMNIEGGVIPSASLEAYLRISCSAGNVKFCPQPIKAAKHNLFGHNQTGKLKLGSDLMLYLTSNAAEFRRVVDWYAMVFPPRASFQHFLNYIKSTPFYTGGWPALDKQRWWIT